MSDGTPQNALPLLSNCFGFVSLLSIIAHITLVGTIAWNCPSFLLVDIHYLIQFPKFDTSCTTTLVSDLW
jgi:hypothetical protein